MSKFGLGDDPVLITYLDFKIRFGNSQNGTLSKHQLLEQFHMPRLILTPGLNLIAMYPAALLLSLSTFVCS